MIIVIYTLYDFIKDTRALLLLLCLSISIIYGAVNGGLIYDDYINDYHDAKKAANELLTSSTKMSDARRSYYVFQEIPRISFLCVTEVLKYPDIILLPDGYGELEPIYLNTFKYDNIAKDKIFIDYMSAIILISSLVVMLLGSTVITDEKEGGTLKYLIAYGCSRRGLVIKKSIAVLLLIAATTAISTIIGALCAELLTGNAILDSIESLLITMVVTILFLSVFALAGVFISSTSKKSSVAMYKSMLFWIAFVIIIPNTVNHLNDREIVSNAIKRKEMLEIKRDNTRQWYQYMIDEANSRNIDVNDIWGDSLMKFATKSITEYSQYKRNLDNRTILNHNSKYSNIFNIIGRYSSSLEDILGAGYKVNMHFRMGVDSSFSKYIKEIGKMQSQGFGISRAIGKNRKGKYVLQETNLGTLDTDILPKIKLGKKEINKWMVLAQYSVEAIVAILLFLLLSVAIMRRYDVR